MSTVGIVTGAGRGMGLACARRLAETVDALLLVDLNEEAVRKVADDLAGGAAKVHPVVLDVTDADGLQALAAQATSLGSLRSVAHAAGISPTMADWRRVISVDLVGTALLLEALRPLAGDGTAFVCFASVAAHLSATEDDAAADAALDEPLHPELLERLQAARAEITDSNVAYGWAKRGVQRLVRREARRLGPVGARICSISPGIIDTPQSRQELEHQPLMAVMLDNTPLRRMGRDDELAAVVAFLLSDEASYLTGTDIRVDGGVLAGIEAIPWQP